MRFKEFKLVSEKVDAGSSFRSSFSDIPSFSDIIGRGVSFDQEPEAGSTTTPGAAYSSQGPGVGETGSARQAVQFFISKGWTPAQAAGIVGNLQAESGANLQTNAIGDGGKAYGIAQWHPERQNHFRKAFNKDIRQAGFKEQLEFVQWELENTERKAAVELKNAKTAQQAAAVFDQFYERSSGAHRGKRIANALALAPTSSTTVA